MRFAFNQKEEVTLVKNKALVTGANGFLGNVVVSELKNRGLDVDTMGSSHTNNRYTFPIDELTNQKQIANAIKQSNPKYVFHLAGSYNETDIESYELINARYGACILKAIEQSDLDEIPNIIFVGSSAEYGWVRKEDLPIKETFFGSPGSMYGKSKLLGTNLAIDWARDNHNLTVVRPFNLIGPNLSRFLAVGNFYNQIFSNNRQEIMVKTGNLSTFRDFVDVRDCASLICELADNDLANGEIVNICSGTAISLQKILGFMIEMSQKTVEVHSSAEQYREDNSQVHYGCQKKLRYFVGNKKLISTKESIEFMINYLGVNNGSFIS